MKKILAIAVVILMVISLVACSGTPVNASQLGVYKGVSVEMDGETMTANDFALGGQNIAELFSLELKSDCKFTLVSGGATFEGTYDYQAPKLILDLQGDKLETAIDGNEITIDLSDSGTDMKITFEK